MQPGQTGCEGNNVKVCFKCKIEKPLEAFYRHKMMADGHLNKCKECTKLDAIKHRDANIEKVREYDRQRARLEHRKATNHATCRKYRAKERKRYKCMTAVGNAIRDGRLQKLPCFVCGADKVEGHHPDYDAPLDVVWLCAVHHKEIHLKHPR